MSRQLSLAAVVSGLALGSSLIAGRRAEVIVASFASPTQGVPRDPTQNQTRLIPIGTGSISGTVTAAGTGLPLGRATLMLNGTSTVLAPARAGGAPGPAASVAGGVGLGISRTTISDDQGRFTFDALPAGQFNISATRDQYLQTNYGATKPNRQGTAIRLADGQQVRLAMAMLHGAVLSGSVFGQNGEPLVGAQVRGLRLTLISGFKRFASTGFATTDDRGTYRMFGLQPGDYILAATPGPGTLMLTERAAQEEAAFKVALAAAIAQAGAGARPSSTISIVVPPPNPLDGPPAGYAPTYYPGAPMVANASSVTVGAGEERVGLDISVVPVRASNVPGIVAGVPGPNVAVQISLLPDDPAADTGSLPGVRASADGAFMLRNVPPGQYTVFAQTVTAPNMGPNVFNGLATATYTPPPQLDASQRLWGRAQLTVDGQASPRLSITLEPGRSISGTVVFDMARPPDLSRTPVMVSVTPAPSAQQTPMFGGPTQVAIAPDGRFVLAGIFPGRYMLRSTGGLVKSALVNGEDTLDFPLVITGERDVANAEITLTDRRTELSGTLSEPSGTVTADYTIVIASADRRYWTPGSRRIATARPAIDGRYTFGNLPPGDYLLAAVTDIEPGGQFDPEFLNAVAGASVRVTLTEGGKATQDIRVAR